MGRWRTSNVGAEFRNPGRRSVWLCIRVIVVRPPERGQVPAEVQFEVARNAVTHTADPGTARPLTGPRGPKPRRVLSRRNVFLYGTLLVLALYYLLPLYVMVVTSLKGLPEIRLGNIFSPPVHITFEPWVRAWSTVCTGLSRSAAGPASTRHRATSVAPFQLE